MLASYALDKIGSEIAMDRLIPASPSPKKEHLSPMHGMGTATIQGLIQHAHPYRHMAKFLETVVPNNMEQSSSQSNSKTNSRVGSRSNSPHTSPHYGTGMGGTNLSSSVVMPRVENSLESGSGSLEASIFTERGNNSTELPQQPQQQPQQQRGQNKDTIATNRKISFRDHPSSSPYREINDDDSIHSQNTQNIDMDVGFGEVEGGRGQGMEEGFELDSPLAHQQQRQQQQRQQKQQQQQQQGLGIESQGEYLSLSQIAHRKSPTGREELVLPSSTAAALANRANANNDVLTRLGDMTSNIPCRHTLSTHPLSPYQHTPYQHTLSPPPLINTPSHRTPFIY